ncbi:hypothetical protein E6C67_22395 [Azospirillum sp. TSA2s]|uniref:hypothetical protein n=1 Tax=Azospirillum sp. TSA2s TaxID=709810 RepID=UPI0010AADF2A|nr:hypothetical protein [Azospirillum sp. TSA2s]QCG96600.1 hypothetical protein E6C67_22395 [Azospirillum sp. TSA2s]
MTPGANPYNPQGIAIGLPADVAVPEKTGMPVLVEKRDPSGRLLARVGIAAGVLEGPCLFFAEDGETVVSRMMFRAGRPLLPQSPGVPSPFLSGCPVAAGESPF